MCPRAYDYPNLDLHMTGEIVDEIIRQTQDYTNYICIAGRGEPLLCKNILDIIETIIVHKKRFYMHTNGDFIHKYIDDLDSLLNLTYTDEGNKPKILLNCYDGIDQWKQFTELYGHFKGINITYDRRDDDKDYVDNKFKIGQYVNRGGTVPWTTTDNLQKPCYILWNKAYFNWNGDLQLCCHDWKYIKTFGNIMTDTFDEMWHKNIHSYRMGLLEYGGRQNFIECKKCDSVQEHENSYKLYQQWCH